MAESSWLSLLLHFQKHWYFNIFSVPRVWNGTVSVNYSIESTSAIKYYLNADVRPQSSFTALTETHFTAQQNQAVYTCIISLFLFSSFPINQLVVWSLKCQTIVKNYVSQFPRWLSQLSCVFHNSKIQFVLMYSVETEKYSDNFDFEKASHRAINHQNLWWLI